MDVQSIALFGGMVVALSFYLMRRRSRLAKED
jgi:hypothetical protein